MGVAVVDVEASSAAATAQLLWAACRPSLDVARIHAAIESGADVPRAGFAALQQRTGPLMWRALDAVGGTTQLGEAEEPLRADFELRRVQAAVLLPIAVARAIEPLTGAGFEPVVFKGPAVAMRYPSPGLRPMDDIDVILPAVQHDAGLAALVAAGWRVLPREGRHYDTVLLHDEVPDVPVELHRELTSWRDRSNRLTSEELWQERVPLECMGTSCFGVRPEHELVALAAHAGKPFHTFQRLIWSVDFAVLIQTAGDSLDWDRVAAFADRYGCSTVVAIALRHAERLGADVPSGLRALPTNRWRRVALQPLIDEGWPAKPADPGEVRRLRYALCDTQPRQIQLFLGEVTREGPVHTPWRLIYLSGRGLRRLSMWRGAGASLGDEGAVARET
jgi:hypothetical protein